MRISTETV